jgi:hypothetical protein
LIALNRNIEDTVEDIRSEFNDVIAPSEIFTWNHSEDIRYLSTENYTGRSTAELIREAALSSIHPDVILVSSLFEGLTDNAATSLNRIVKNVPTAVILYDLIPLIYPSPYLDNIKVARWYNEKISHLKKSGLNTFNLRVGQARGD